jgi:hypothetical protein
LISSTLVHTDGSCGLMIGLTENDLDQISSGQPKVIELSAVKLGDTGNLIISYLDDHGIIMVPLNMERENDVMIMLDAEQLESLADHDGFFGFNREDVPFRIVLFYGKEDQDLRLFMEQTLRDINCRRRGDTPTDRTRPSLN